MPGGDDTSPTNQTNGLTQETLIEALDSVRARKDVTRLPEFFGEADKDSITATGFIKRVEFAAKAAKWSDDQTVYYMRLALAGKAEQWYEITADSSEAAWEKDFDRVSSDLILRFEPSASGTRTLATISQMKQSGTESVQDYADRLRRIAMQWRRSAPMPAASTSEEQKVHARLGMRTMSEYILLTMFTQGLKEALKNAVMVQCPGTINEALEIALNHEAGLANMKSSNEEPRGAKISPVERENEAEVDALGARRTTGGTTGTTYRGNNNTNNSGSTNQGCFYCGKMGHIKRDCLKKKRDWESGRGRGRGRGGYANNNNRSGQRSISSAQTNQEEDRPEEEERSVAATRYAHTLNFLGIA